MVTTLLDVIGIVALVIAGFYLAVFVGFGVVGAGCLVLSWKLSRPAPRRDG